MVNIPKLRVARPTDQLQAVTDFYCGAFGFEILGEFRDHDGFDGTILGHSDAPWHLEFTHKKGHHAGRAPTQDNLLVFYLPDEAQWRRQVETLRSNGHSPMTSFNPYWDKVGITFEDPDKYRVVLQNASWDR